MGNSQAGVAVEVGREIPLSASGLLTSTSERASEGVDAMLAARAAMVKAVRQR